MKKRLVIFCALAAFLLSCGHAAFAADLKFRYRNGAGEECDITSVDDLNAAIPLQPNGRRADPNAYTILNDYLTGCQDTKDRVDGLENDITVTVNSCTDPAKVDLVGSWSSGPEIQIQTRDHYRARSTLAHEVGHSVMRENFGGKQPTHTEPKTVKYGLDGAHYLNEITTFRSGFCEGYAEYWGDKSGGGQEQIPSTGGYILKRESTNVAGDYTNIAWTDVTNSWDMWKSEYINSRLLKDFANNITNGADKIEDLMDDGFCENLRDFIFRWRNKYPEDSDKLARIVDIDTNFTMTDDSLRQMTGANDYINNDRDNARTKYEDQDSNTSLRDTFAPPPATPPAAGTGTGGGTGTGTGTGTGAGDTGKGGDKGKKPPKPGTGLPPPAKPPGGGTGTGTGTGSEKGKGKSPSLDEFR